MFGDEYEDELAWQEREFDAAQDEAEADEALRHDPPAKYFTEVFNERAAMVKRLPFDTIQAATAAAKAEAGIHSGHGLVRGRSILAGTPGPLIFDTRLAAPAPAAPAGDLFADRKGAPR